MRGSFWAAVAGLLGAIAVAVGALAAHGISDPKAAGWAETGARYLLVHAVLLVAIARDPRLRWARWLVLVGCVLFCFSLFGLAAGLPRRLGAVTPFGGAALILAWLLLAWRGLRAG